MAQTLDEQIRFAIAHKRLLEVTYKGTARIVEPHDYGVITGTTRVFVYQLRPFPPSARKNVTRWRMLDVPKIERCAVTEETFKGSRGEAGQRHHVWDVLYARVQ